MRSNNTNETCDYFEADCRARRFDRKSITSFCTFVIKSVVRWKSKKQSAEAEYRAIASTTSELMWIKQLLSDM